MIKIGSTNTSRQKKTSHEVPKQSAVRAIFYIARDPSRRARSTTQCTNQRVPSDHKRVPLEPAARRPLLVVTGQRMCLLSAVFHSLLFWQPPQCCKFLGGPIHQSPHRKASFSNISFSFFFPLHMRVFLVCVG